MQNQEIVFISRSRDRIIVQGKNDVYDDTLENFAIDYGTPVPESIQEADRCWDTGHAVLNGKVMTETDAEIEEYLKTLLSKAHELYEIQYARLNPPAPPEPEPTEEEKQLMALQEEISEAKGYLYETDYRILKFIDKKIKENPELLAEFQAEYPDTLDKRAEARAKVNEVEVQVNAFSEAIALSAGGGN